MPNQKIKNILLAPILAAIIILLLILSTFLDREILQYQNNLYLSIIILYLLILVMPGIFYSKLKGTGYIEKLNIRLFGPNKLIFLAALFFAMVCGSMILKLFQYSMNIYSVQITYFDRYLPSGSLTSTNPAYVILAYAILPAVAEEFIFRGVLVTEYATGGIGQINTIFLTAVLYAMSYFDFVQFPVHFLTGIMFAIAVFVTQSLIASIALHTIYNLFVIYTEDYMMRLAGQTGNVLIYIFIMLTCVFAFVIIAFASAEKIYYLYSVEKDDDPFPVTEGAGGLKRFADAAISPAYIVCVMLFIAASIIL